MAEVRFTHEYPPIPIRTMDWRAGFDGQEEEGRDGFGETKLRAALDLWHQCRDPEEMLACIVAILRAELESDRAYYDERDTYAAGFACAIRTVEGIE